MICPLCNNKAETILTDKLRHSESRPVFHCKYCDLGFIENLESQERLKQFYTEEYRKKYGPKLDKKTDSKDLFDCHINFQEDRLKIISPYLDREKSLLEIGCSAGMFLYNIRDKVKKMVGIEFDKSAAEYASEKCNCKVYTEELPDLSLDKKSFDIICAFQVMEHVESPLNFLLHVKEYLKDNGIIYIEVPNLYDVLVSTYNLPNHKQFYYHSAHLYYFSKNSLRLLFEKAGFSGNFYFTQDYNILNHFHWILNDKPQSSCMPGLSAPEFPFQNNISNLHKTKMNIFLTRIDEEYKRLLTDLELTSNISFIGVKKN